MSRLQCSETPKCKLEHLFGKSLNKSEFPGNLAIQPPGQNFDTRFLEDEKEFKMISLNELEICAIIIKKTKKIEL